MWPWLTTSLKKRTCWTLGCPWESTTVPCLLCWEGWIWSHVVWQLEKQVPKNSSKRGNVYILLLSVPNFSCCSFILMFRVQGYWINMRACMSCWLIPFLFKPRSKRELHCSSSLKQPACLHYSFGLLCCIPFLEITTGCCGVESLPLCLSAVR